MIAAVFDNMNVTNVVLVLAVVGYLIDRVIDAKGWSRSSKLLRRENEDLVRRNTELEADVHRLDVKVLSLEEQVRELRRSDQAAVLVALKDHEIGAKERHRINVGLLERVASALEDPPN